MKKVLFLASSLLSLPLLSMEYDRSLVNSFVVWGEFAYFSRAQGNKHRLIIDEGHGHLNSCGGCNFETCDSHKLVRDFDYRPGFQVGMAYMTPHSIFEAKYLWINKWESHCHKEDPGKLYFSESNLNFGQDFFQADRASAEYSSQFQNAEMNYFWYLNPRRGNYFSAAWLAGVRYMHLVETLEIEFHKASNESSYRIHVWDDIPAIQAGGVISWNPTRTLSWDLGAKLGIGFDHNRQHTFLGDLNNTVTLRDFNATKWSTPVVVEGSLAFTYQPWRFIDLHVAYEMIYLNGIAVAPNQIDKTNKERHRVKPNGFATIHGLLAGMTFSF